MSKDRVGSDTTKVIIVDDQALFAELLGRTLATEPGFEVAGIAHDGKTAIQMARQLQPQAALMDIELPGELDGIEAALQIKQERPQTGIVILSMHNDRRYITSLPLEESPGWAYLLKQSVPDLATIVRAIQGSIQGMMVLDPAVVMTLRPRQGSILTGLTRRQLQVLELIAQGFSNAAIAERLVLTERSVETYIHAIYQQLQLTGEQDTHSRVKATLIFLQESRNR